MGFAQEYLFVVMALIALGGTGGFILVPFRQISPFLVLAAPMAGIPVLALGLAGFYALLGVAIPAAGLVTIAAGTVLTIVSVVLAGIRPRLYWSALGYFLIVSAVVTVMMSTATIVNQSPSIYYIDGSDQTGYAGSADWALNHPAAGLPRVSPSRPYESYPAYMAETDPRFGAIYLLAFTAWLRGSPALFVFDTACAIVFAASVLGIGAAYARRRTTLVLLTAGLLTSCWYDHAKGGFFGKLLGYPQDFLMLRLFVEAVIGRDRLPGIILAVLAGAVAILHSGSSTIAVLLPAGTLFLLFTLAADRRSAALRRQSLDGAALLGLMCFVAASQTGIFGRPGALTAIGFNAPITDSLGVVVQSGLDLQGSNPHPAYAGLPEAVLQGLATTLVIGWLGLIAIGLAIRNWLSAALLGASAASLIGFIVIGNYWLAYQMIGIYGTALLCAGTVLADDPALRGRRAGWVVLAVLAVALLGRQPRFVGALERYALGLDPHQEYSQCEMQAVRKIVKDNKIFIDLADIHDISALLISFGSHQDNVAWSEPGWNRLFAYRGWAPPPIEEADLRIVLPSNLPSGAAPLLRTPQFVLVSTKGQALGKADKDAIAQLHCALAKPESEPGYSIEATANMPPSGVNNFPAGLSAPRLFFSGVSQDGWLQPVSRVVLYSAKANRLHILGSIPDFVAPGKIAVSVDGAPPIDTEVKPGALDLRIPLAPADKPRKIDLKLTESGHLPDDRVVSLKLTAIELETD